MSPDGSDPTPPPPLSPEMVLAEEEARKTGVDGGAVADIASHAIDIVAAGGLEVVGAVAEGVANAASGVVSGVFGVIGGLLD